jgi:hypothetical protein
MRIFLIISSLCLSIVCSAQSNIFDKHYGIPNFYESSSCHVNTNDNGFAQLKFMASSQGMAMRIIKTDSLGAIQWSKNIKTLSNIAWATIDQSNDHHFYIAKNDSDNRIGILKLSPTGAVKWLRNYAIGAQEFYTSRPEIICTSDGGCVVAASYFSGMDVKWHLMKTDSAGTVLWSTTIFQETYQETAFVNLCECSNGDIAVTGNSVATQYLPVVIRVSPNGNLISSRIIPYLWTYTIVSSIAAATDNGVVIGGYIPFGGGFYMLKLDSLNNLVWGKRYPVPTNVIGLTAAVATNDHGFVLAGGDANGLLLKIDSMGNSQWLSQIDSLWLQSVSVRQAGYAVTGYNAFGRCPLIGLDQNGIGNCMYSVAHSTVTLLNPTPYTLGPAINLPVVVGTSSYLQPINTLITNNYCLTTSETTLEDKGDEVLIYPVPAVDFITIRASQNIQSLTIKDVSGRIVYRAEADKAMEIVNVSGFPTGIYFVELNCGEKYFVRKILIEKE